MASSVTPLCWLCCFKLITFTTFRWATVSPQFFVVWSVLLITEATRGVSNPWLWSKLFPLLEVLNKLGADLYWLKKEREKRRLNSVGWVRSEWGFLSSLTFDANSGFLPCWKWETHNPISFVGLDTQRKLLNFLGWFPFCTTRLWLTFHNLQFPTFHSHQFPLSFSLVFC